MMKEKRPARRSRRTMGSLALAGSLTTLAVVLGAGNTTTPPAKDATVTRMLEIGKQVLELRGERQTGDVRNAINRLTREYNTLSAKLGGDDPAQLGAPRGDAPAAGGEEGGLASAPAAPAGCTASTTAYSNLNPVAIPNNPVQGTPVTSTIVVSGIDPVITDVNMTTFITHTFPGDIDMTLTSPAGTVVTITTDNGGTNDDVFNGTVWDDDANPAGQVPYATNDGVATDHAYVLSTLASPLVPEEAMGAFIGEDPNGVWTLSISDDAAGDTGFLNSWSLAITTTPTAPTTTLTSGSMTTPVAIPTTVATVTSTITISGAPPVLVDVNAITAITHNNCADLDITLQSPVGTVVTLTTDNGGTNDNVFGGTTWDDDANPGGTVPYTANNGNGIASDHTYVNLTAAAALVPEEAMAAFIGEDPNGIWTLTISDDATSNGGSLNSWSLDILSIAAAPPTSTSNFSNTTPVGIDQPAAAATSTIVVSGAGAYLWDLDLSTTLVHTACDNLDFTITSPAGTVVTLSTDNGGTNDNVFSGTSWDDDANPLGLVPYTSNNGLVGDQTYLNLNTATPLVAEEPLGAFVGENPNGTWTISVTDDTAGADAGSLNAWSMSLTTLDATPTDASAINVANATGAVITTAAAPQVITQTVAVSGAGTFLRDVNLNLNVTHSFPGDLDITLASPAGTIVTITTDNGAGNDNVFAGTTFDDDADPDGQVPFVNNNGSVSDHLYANLTVAPLLTPEEALAAFIGEDPNGTWTLTISDDATGDGGNLVSWSLDLITCVCSAPQPCPADTNDDGQVNVTDLLAVIGQWGTCVSPPCSADINGDNEINVTDLLAVIGAWGPCP